MPRWPDRAKLFATMNDFPQFMKHPANRISQSGQATPGVEGYIFDGADGSQMAFWNCRETAASAAHAHEFDEYMIVVEGCYTLIIEGERARSISSRGAWSTAAKCSAGRGPFTRLEGTGRIGGSSTGRREAASPQQPL